MEQTPYRVNWREHNVPKAPGQMRGLSYQALARGASGVLFFQWRASRPGPRSSTRRCCPTPGRRRRSGREVTALGAELAGGGGSTSAPVRTRVAVVFSWPNWWAVESPASPAHDFRMLDQVALDVPAAVTTGR